MATEKDIFKDWIKIFKHIPQFAKYYMDEEHSESNYPRDINIDYFMSKRIHVWSKSKSKKQQELTKEEKLQDKIKNLEYEISDYIIKRARDENYTSFNMRRGKLNIDNQNEIIKYCNGKENILKEMAEAEDPDTKTMLKRKFVDMRQQEKFRRMFNTREKILNDRIERETDQGLEIEMLEKKKRLEHLKEKEKSNEFIKLEKKYKNPEHYKRRIDFKPEDQQYK